MDLVVEDAFGCTNINAYAENNSRASEINIYFIFILVLAADYYYSYPFA